MFGGIEFEYIATEGCLFVTELILRAEIGGDLRMSPLMNEDTWNTLVYLTKGSQGT